MEALGTDLDLSLVRKVLVEKGTKLSYVFVKVRAERPYLFRVLIIERKRAGTRNVDVIESESQLMTESA